MEEVRCSNYGKLLVRTEGKEEIICPRCKIKNKYNTESQEAQGE